MADWVLAGFIVILFIVNGMVDPWGIAAASLSRSASVSISLAAPWYRGFEGAEQAGDMISTILVDEAYIKETGGMYPLPYKRQISLLTSAFYRDAVDGDRSDGEILPRGFMMDILYANNRSFDPEIYEVLAELKRNLDAQLESDEADRKSIQAELKASIAAIDRQDINSRLTNFTRELSDIGAYDTEIGNADEDGLLAAALSDPSHVRPVVGAIVVDEILDMPDIAAGGTVEWSPRRAMANQANMIAAPSLLAPGTMRYAIAPDGVPSPALNLMLWVCAKPLETLEGGPDTANLAGCSEAETAVSPQQIYEAAHAAAMYRVAERCLSFVEFPHRLGKNKTLASACRDAGLKVAANANWAPEDPPDVDRKDPYQYIAALARAYSRSRRNGTFDGAMEASTCIGSSPNAVGHTCGAIRNDAADRRIGPTMTILWGASPRDGGPPRSATKEEMNDFLYEEKTSWKSVKTTAISAPYTFVQDKDQNRILPDLCEDYRFEQTWTARLGEMGGRLASLVGFDGGSWFYARPDLCPYHTNVNPLTLGAESKRIRRFLNHAVDGRIVIVGASVAGNADTHEMRGVTAPGAWAHAMALDNLLVMGSRYIPATIDRMGFEETTGGSLKQILTELFFAAGIGLVFHIGKLRRRLDPRIDRAAKKLCTRRGIVCFVFDIFSAGTMALVLMLSISLIFVLVLPSFLPPIDWIGISALAVLVWQVLATDTAPASSPQPLT